MCDLEVHVNPSDVSWNCSIVIACIYIYIYICTAFHCAPRANKIFLCSSKTLETVDGSEDIFKHVLFFLHAGLNITVQQGDVL